MTEHVLCIGGLGLIFSLCAIAVGAQWEKCIMIADEVAKYVRPADSGISQSPTWSQTKQEIEDMEASFDKLAVLKPAHDCCQYLGKFAFTPEEYYMQYAAVFVDGHAFIYINGFRTLREGWVD